MPPLVHPTAIISTDAKLADDVRVGARWSGSPTLKAAWFTREHPTVSPDSVRANGAHSLRGRYASHESLRVLSLRRPQLLKPEPGSLAMKYLALALLLAAILPFAGSSADKKPAAPPGPTQQPAPPNPNIDMDAYVRSVKEVANHRETRRLTEDDFIKMSAEEGTIVLDARSKDMFNLMHIEGAINLSFPDIAIESLKKTLPDKEARILIYCNNNFKNEERAFPRKAEIASLNISTYIALYNYGYRNVYELGPQIDPAKSKIVFVSAPKPPRSRAEPSPGM